MHLKKVCISLNNLLMPQILWAWPLNKHVQCVQCHIFCWQFVASKLMPADQQHVAKPNCSGLTYQEPRKQQHRLLPTRTRAERWLQLNSSGGGRLALYLMNKRAQRKQTDTLYTCWFVLPNTGLVGLIHHDKTTTCFQGSLRNKIHPRNICKKIHNFILCQLYSPRTTSLDSRDLRWIM